MSLRAVLVLFLILLVTHGAFSYPGGPPTSICSNSPEVFLRPGASHGNPQAGNGGFLISTDLPLSEDNAGGYNYTAGRLYTGRLLSISLGSETSFSYTVQAHCSLYPVSISSY